ncbi:MAG: 50S ribosomal protein L29 [bacterium]|nr:50S ribosomal protein L29 [bacterium]
MKEIKKKSDADLAKLLKEKKEGLKNFRFGLAGSKNRNIKDGLHLRREIARLLTELTARKIS